jgi:ubiquinone/menaquinone biosynthesis C-methylase UbiE
MVQGARGSITQKTNSEDYVFMNDNREVLDYWNRVDVESMYDKHLLSMETRIISKRIPENSKVLDVGCGEGECAYVYAQVRGTKILGVDFSDTRLAKAASLLAHCGNVALAKCDMLKPIILSSDYDIVISQRFLINLMEWDLQKMVLGHMVERLKKGGRLLLLEGCQQGTQELNRLRASFGLDPIPVKWHNLFLDETQLIPHMLDLGCALIDTDGLGSYFVLTRAIRPIFDKDLNWDCEFNKNAASEKVAELIGGNNKFSRLKLWVFERF